MRQGEPRQAERKKFNWKYVVAFALFAVVVVGITVPIVKNNRE